MHSRQQLEIWLADAASVIAAAGSTLNVEAKPGADAQSIRIAEERVGFAFPSSYRSFLTWYDGMKLGIPMLLPHGYTFESTLEIFGTAQIAEATRVLSDAWGREEEFIDLFVFADYMDSNHCGFDARLATADEYPVVDIFHEDPAFWREPIAASFADWLQRCFEAVINERNYFTYWLPANLDQIRAFDGS